MVLWLRESVDVNDNDSLPVELCESLIVCDNDPEGEDVSEGEREPERLSVRLSESLPDSDAERLSLCVALMLSDGLSECVLVFIFAEVGTASNARRITTAAATMGGQSDARRIPVGVVDY